MSRRIRFDVASVDALRAFQALTRHSSPDEGVFAEKTRNPDAITDIRSGVGGEEDARKQKDID
jgi:hypothetical protein